MEIIKSGILPLLVQLLDVFDVPVRENVLAVFSSLSSYEDRLSLDSIIDYMAKFIDSGSIKVEFQIGRRGVIYANLNFKGKGIVRKYHA